MRGTRPKGFWFRRHIAIPRGCSRLGIKPIWPAHSHPWAVRSNSFGATGRGCTFPMPASSSKCSDLPGGDAGLASRSERSAARYLRKQGFRIIACNWSTPQGELDIVAVDDGCIVFVEVRSTAGDDTERPASSVDFAKQETIRLRMSLQYLQAKNLLSAGDARFDVLAISWPAVARRNRPSNIFVMHSSPPTGFSSTPNSARKPHREKRRRATCPHSPRRGPGCS